MVGNNSLGRIGNADSLMIKSLNGNSNLKIPEKLQQRFVENGGEDWFVQN